MTCCLSHTPVESAPPVKSNEGDKSPNISPCRARTECENTCPVCHVTVLVTWSWRLRCSKLTSMTGHALLTGQPVLPVRPSLSHNLCDWSPCLPCNLCCSKKTTGSIRHRPLQLPWQRNADCFNLSYLMM